MKIYKKILSIFAFILFFLSIDSYSQIKHNNLFAQNDTKKMPVAPQTVHPKEDTIFVQVYPNLEKGEAYIVVNSTHGFATVEASVYNVLGKKLMTSIHQNVKPQFFTSMYMSEFPNGIYIFKIKADHKTFIRKMSWLRT